MVKLSPEEAREAMGLAETASPEAIASAARQSLFDIKRALVQSVFIPRLALARARKLERLSEAWHVLLQQEKLDSDAVEPRAIRWKQWTWTDAEQVLKLPDSYSWEELFRSYEAVWASAKLQWMQAQDPTQALSGLYHLIEVRFSFELLLVRWAAPCRDLYQAAGHAVEERKQADQATSPALLQALRNSGLPVDQPVQAGSQEPSNLTSLEVVAGDVVRAERSMELLLGNTSA